MDGATFCQAHSHQNTKRLRSIKPSDLYRGTRHDIWYLLNLLIDDVL